MSVRYLNATGTQALINEAKSRLAQKASVASVEAINTRLDSVAASVPTKTSQLENDSGFIDNEAGDAKYYLRTEAVALANAVQANTDELVLLNEDVSTPGSIKYMIDQAIAEAIGLRVYDVVTSAELLGQALADFLQHTATFALVYIDSAITLPSTSPSYPSENVAYSSVIGSIKPGCIMITKQGSNQMFATGEFAFRTGETCYVPLNVVFDSSSTAANMELLGTPDSGSSGSSIKYVDFTAEALETAKGSDIIVATCNENALSIKMRDNTMRTFYPIDGERVILVKSSSSKQTVYIILALEVCDTQTSEGPYYVFNNLNIDISTMSMTLPALTRFADGRNLGSFSPIDADPESIADADIIALF